MSEVERIELYKTPDGKVFTNIEDAKEYAHFEEFMFDAQELIKNDSGSFPISMSNAEVTHPYLADGTFHRFFTKFIKIYQKYYPNPEIAGEDVIHYTPD